MSDLEVVIDVKAIVEAICCLSLMLKVYKPLGLFLSVMSNKHGQDCSKY